MQNAPVVIVASARCPTQMQFYTPSSTNLFVRYLSREVDDDRLRAIFSAFGNITSSMVMRDIYSGQSLGTAFVRYEKHEEALRALRDAHGMPLLGKTVSVQWA
ncbi:putative RNA recognition motif (RRM, RBD, or RNP domain), partial [Leishmania shawi]